MENAVELAAGAMAPSTIDDRSFVVVYHDRYAALVRLAVLMVGDRATAEEVTQDAFVAAYARWARIETPPAYIRRAVVNRCRDVLRRRKLAEALHLRRREDGATVGGADYGPEVEHPEVEHLDDVLAVLSARQRMAVVLRFYEDLTVEQIADTMQTRPNTVKSLLHRGLARMREDLT